MFFRGRIFCPLGITVKRGAGAENQIISRNGEGLAEKT